MANATQDHLAGWLASESESRRGACSRGSRFRVRRFPTKIATGLKIHGKPVLMRIYSARLNLKAAPLIPFGSYKDTNLHSCASK